MNMKLTDVRLCEELECLLGAREEIPLIVSLLRVLGLITCLPLNGPVQKQEYIRHTAKQSQNLKFSTIKNAYLSLKKMVFLSSSVPRVFPPSSGPPFLVQPASVFYPAFLVDEL